MSVKITESMQATNKIAKIIENLLAPIEKLLTNKVAKFCQSPSVTSLLDNPELKSLFTPEYFELIDQKCAVYKNLYDNKLVLENLIVKAEQANSIEAKLEISNQVEIILMESTTSAAAIQSINKQTKLLKLKDNIDDSVFKELTKSFCSFMDQSDDLVIQHLCGESSSEL